MPHVVVCSQCGRVEEARLIAAAPELLASLKAMVAFIELGDTPEGFDEAEALIARIEGTPEGAGPG